MEQIENIEIVKNVKRSANKDFTFTAGIKTNAFNLSESLIQKLGYKNQKEVGLLFGFDKKDKKGYILKSHDEQNYVAKHNPSRKIYSFTSKPLFNKLCETFDLLNVENDNYTFCFVINKKPVFDNYYEFELVKK